MTDSPSHERRGEIRERRQPPEARIVRAPSWSVLLPALLLLPGVLTGQVPEEKSYAPEQMLSCDFTFAVFAPVQGDPRTVRRCPGTDNGPLFFASPPVVDLTHLDSVAAAPAGSGSWRVDARLTGEGARRLEEGEPEDWTDPVGVVFDGRVVSRFAPRSGVRSDRLVVLDGVSESRASEVTERLRSEAWRASARRDGGLWRLLWHPRPGGALDRAYREDREKLMEVCGEVRGACARDRHAPRDVIEDSVRAEPRAGAPARGVLAVRLQVRSPANGGVDDASLGYQIVYRSGTDGREVVLRWLDDWGYGVRWYARARGGSWVAIPGGRGWLDAGTGPIRGEVTSARGDLVTLKEPVTARRGDAGGVRPGAVRLPARSYRVLGIREGTMWLRPERPSDMPCPGGERVPDGEEPTVFPVEIDAFFRPDGTSRIRPTYPRGC